VALTELEKSVIKKLVSSSSKGIGSRCVGMTRVRIRVRVGVRVRGSSFKGVGLRCVGMYLDRLCHHLLFCFVEVVVVVAVVAFFFFLFDWFPSYDNGSYI
jgi:hypothetical protein